MEGLLVPLCVYVILAVSLNLTVGILGELSLGHAGFMCVGAFASAFFLQVYGRRYPGGGPEIFPGNSDWRSCGCPLWNLIGIPVLRLKGDYLAIVTLAFGEIIKNLINVFLSEKTAMASTFP